MSLEWSPLECSGTFYGLRDDVEVRDFGSTYYKRNKRKLIFLFHLSFGQEILNACRLFLQPRSVYEMYHFISRWSLSYTQHWKTIICKFAPQWIEQVLFLFKGFLRVLSFCWTLRGFTEKMNMLLWAFQISFKAKLGVIKPEAGVANGVKFTKASQIFSDVFSCLTYTDWISRTFRCGLGRIASGQLG